MKYHIIRESDEAAYLQLYRQLRNDITEGVYRFGDRLPSKRTLAEDTGTSVITTEHTYVLLEEEGYIEARQRSGYYVCYRAGDTFPVAERTFRLPDSSSGNSPSSGADFAVFNSSSIYSPPKKSSEASGPSQHFFSKAGNSGTPPYAQNSGNSETASSAQESANPETASIAQESANATSAAEDFPFSVYARTMRRVLTEYGARILDRAPMSGCEELRTALSEYLARSRGIRVNPDQILIGSGSEYLYGLVVRMLGRDRVIALEDPSYEKIRRVYEAEGVNCEPLEMGHDGIKSSALAASHASVLHVTPFHSYPTGVTATASKRQEYIRWARTRGGSIIEDDYDSEFTMSTKAEETLFSLEPTHTVFYLNTFTKTISSSLRIGYMVLPSDLADKLLDSVNFYSCTVPVFDQLVLAEFIRNGDFERHINRVRRKRRREARVTS